MDETQISLELLAAYEGSVFHVYSEPQFTLSIGKTCPLADSVMAMFIAQTAIVITACNPFSNVLSSEENHRRNALLVHELTTMGYFIVNALGQDPKGEWPGEPGFFVMNIDKNTAAKLANKYQQNAIVWYELSGEAELMLLR